MPQDTHLALVEGLFDAWGRDNLEEWLTFVDPDAEFDYTELDRPYSGVYRGRERIETFYHEASDRWRKAEFLINDPLVDGDLVVVDVTRMASSPGLDVLASATILITVHAGKIVRFKPFRTRLDALTAAGLVGKVH